MPPKRSRNPARNSQATINSEYETDNATDTNAALLAAPPPKRSITDMNMAVLRRYVPNIHTIEAIANFATVYNLAAETGTWEKFGIEGTLFVCQLIAPNGDITYNVVILNRKSMENFIAEVKSNDDVEITDDWIFLQVPDKVGEGKTSVYGLWILEDAELGAVNTRKTVSAKIQECVVRAEASRGEGPVEQATQQQQEVHELDGQAETPHVSQPTTQGQQIPLHALFGSNAGASIQSVAPPASANHHHPVQPPQLPQQQPQRPQFSSASDTDFFQSLQGHASQLPPAHASMQQSSQFIDPSQGTQAFSSQQRAAHNVSQGALLDLFKNAKRG